MMSKRRRLEEHQFLGVLAVGERPAAAAAAAAAAVEEPRSEGEVSTSTTEEDGNSSEDTSTSTSAQAEAGGILVQQEMAPPALLRGSAWREETVAAREPHQQHQQQAQVQELIPGLPNEISTFILARLPRISFPMLRQVSTAWRDLLRPNSIYRIRQDLGLVDHWVFLGTGSMTPNQPTVWRMLDPCFMRWHALPNGTADLMFDSCDRECFVAGRQLLVVGRTTILPAGGYTSGGVPRYAQKIRGFDSEGAGWYDAQTMLEDRSLFASATCGSYGYVAGGTGPGGAPRQSAERYNSETGQWEMLQPMHVPRRECSGFFMDNCFHVIGGMSVNHLGTPVALNSAERYDVESNTWTLVEGMWPEVLPAPNSGERSPPLVAVLNNQLYALNAANYELMSMNKGTMQWSSLGRVPSRAVNSDGWGMGFKAMGDELWVMGGKGAGNVPVPHIDACSLQDGVAVWRRVTNLWNHFVLNCAVMRS